jgi:hypothetical protein
VVEQTEVFGAFTRSAELTRGNRWRIFGLFVIYFIATILVEAVLGVVGGVASVFGGPHAVLRLVLLTPLISVVTNLIGAVGAAVLYVDLRRIKDGVGADNLAAVFD